MKLRLQRPLRKLRAGGPNQRSIKTTGEGSALMRKYIRVGRIAHVAYEASCTKASHNQQGIVLRPSLSVR